MKISNIRRFGPVLIDNGYLVCSLFPGLKASKDEDWPERSRTKEECLGQGYGPEFGVGILCGKGKQPVYCIDVDSLDAEVSEEFKSWVLGHFGFEYLLFERVGQAPKFALLVRAEEAGWKRMKSPEWEKGGRTIHMEILGEGQMFCAFHEHPKTHLPYTWPELSPAELPVSDLPVVTRGQLEEAVAAFNSICEKHGYYRPGAQSLAGDDDDLDPGVKTPIGLSAETVKEMLFDVVPNLEDVCKIGRTHLKTGRDAWLNIGARLHFEFSGSDEGLRLWDEWSRDKEGYRSFESLQKIWNSFKRDGEAKVLTFYPIMWRYFQRHPDFSYELNEIGLAFRVLKYFTGRFRFAKDGAKTGTWYEFTNGHWHKSDKFFMGSLVREVLTNRLLQEIEAEKDPEHQKRLRTFWGKLKSAAAKNITNTVNILSTFSELWVNESDFDRELRYFGTANGDIDLHTGELLAPDPRRMISKYSSVSFEQNADCPLWRRTLVECLGSEEMAQYMQVLVGCAALGCERETIFPVFWGKGCNGKSTILRVLSMVFGSYATSLPSETLIAGTRGSKGGTREDIAVLAKSRLAIASETDSYARLDEEFVKKVTGHDPVSFRENFKSQRKEVFNCLMVMATNYAPDVTGTDDGIWNRMQLIEFPRNFNTDPVVKKNNHLLEDLRKEFPGILKWTADGAKNYLKVGHLELPDALKKKTKEYRREQDVFLTWAEENCVFGEEAQKITDKWGIKNRKSVRALFASWLPWAKQNGALKVAKRRCDFASLLKSKGYQLVKDNHGPDWFEEIALKDFDEF